MRHPIPTVLVTGPSARARETAIAQALQDPSTPRSELSAVILEGLSDGNPVLEISEKLLISRIAPGCLCCAGNLVMRVTLNRLLRQRPARLFIGVADTAHLDQLRSWLSSAPYDQLLALTPDLHS
ncbi:GTPase [Massilia sp. Mn16-1_5]|uniref:GTPase n=1 Tax=Massilia sp. Mn16-1_5 TaxID=2079199 RepID=UPI00109E9432|nr:GTPase [Massilia sp. Mn16-1_5]THC39774.1 GTPase [Massilia sp. Mn16-1_5]